MLSRERSSFGIESGGVDHGPKVDDPSEKEEPQNGSEYEKSESGTEPSLK